MREKIATYYLTGTKVNKKINWRRKKYVSML